MNMNTAQLQGFCTAVRRDIINMTANAGSGHPGGSLSAVELVSAIFCTHMRIDPKNPREPDRDRRTAPDHGSAGSMDPRRTSPDWTGNGAGGPRLTRQACSAWSGTRTRPACISRTRTRARTGGRCWWHCGGD